MSEIILSCGRTLEYAPEPEVAEAIVTPALEQQLRSIVVTDEMVEAGAKACRDITFNALTMDECRDAVRKALEAALNSAHDLYKTGDPDAPDVLKDRNGEVVLDMCRICGKGEVELSEPCERKGL